MGEGYEPHVDQISGKLFYSIPVASGFAGFSFTFEITPEDLEVLLSDRYRRAVLQVAAHTLLQQTTTPGGAKFTQFEFDRLVADVLHAEKSDLDYLISRLSHTHNIGIEYYVTEAMEGFCR